MYIDCINKKFGAGTFAANQVTIMRKCNQKCLDTSKRFKKQEMPVEKKETAAVVNKEQ